MLYLKCVAKSGFAQDGDNIQGAESGRRGMAAGDSVTVTFTVRRLPVL